MSYLFHTLLHMASQNLVSSKLQIEAVQSVTPFQTTDPRQTLRVSVTEPADSGIFRTCLNLIMYYNKVADEDSGWIIAGWIKESLSKVLVEQPMLTGRLRRGEDGNGGLEVVSNDSGARLIEAKIAMTLSEFLGSKESSEDAEAELVFWKDVDEQNPQYSPLFYVQVTNFECGGHSVGISCSILLADLLLMEDFLKKWANIHNAVLAKNDGPNTPLFYLPNLKKPSYSAALYPSSSNQSKTWGKTMMFKISDRQNLNLENESGKKLILACVEDAEHKLGVRMASKFPVFLRGSYDVLRIESCTKHGNELVGSQLKLRNQISTARWDDLGANEIAFGQGNKPARVTNWIGSVCDGIVMATPSSSVEGACELNVIVSIPCEKLI